MGMLNASGQDANRIRQMATHDICQLRMSVGIAHNTADEGHFNTPRGSPRSPNVMGHHIGTNLSAYPILW